MTRGWTPLSMVWMGLSALGLVGTWTFNVLAIVERRDFFGDWDMTSVAAYAAYRHPITDYFYLKGRLGLVRYEIDTSVPSVSTGTETQLAAGFGAGWKVGPGSLEVDLTTYESDALFLAAGFHMSF